MTAIMQKQYNVGDELVTCGDKICLIVGQTDRAGVFLIEGDKIRWEYYADNLLPEAGRYATSKYETLWYELSGSTAKTLRRPLIVQIANSLFSALHADNASAIDGHFKAVEESVHYNARANQSFRYLLGALTALGVTALTEVCVGFLIGVPTDTARFFIAAAAGGVGAIMSVLQRLSSLEIDRHAPLWYAVLQGAARVALGVLFGVFFALANKANIVLGTFAENLYAVAAFSVLAGISERFVPEMIRRMESGEVSRAASDHQPNNGMEPRR